MYLLLCLSLFLNIKNNYFLDSKQSNEYINFKMTCFVRAIIFWGSKNAFPCLIFWLFLSYFFLSNIYLFIYN